MVKSLYLGLWTGKTWRRTAEDRRRGRPGWRVDLARAVAPFGRREDVAQAPSSRPWLHRRMVQCYLGPVTCPERQPPRRCTNVDTPCDCLPIRSRVQPPRVTPRRPEPPEPPGKPARTDRPSTRLLVCPSLYRLHRPRCDPEFILRPLTLFVLPVWYTASGLWISALSYKQTNFLVLKLN